MAGKAPRLSAKEIIAVLERDGFMYARQSGSHRIYKNRIGRRVTVPFHGRKILHPKVLRSICDDMGITLDELTEKL